MNLQLSSTYTREEIHHIFSPDTIFTPQAGTWGLQGVVPIPDRENDYVFFVTYGQEQGGHEFSESITDDGVLTWQSQPSQRLDSKRIQQWVNHNELVNNIYLFLRTEKGEPYQYMGRLKYLTHDASREKPVYFQWQLLNWDKSEFGSLLPITLIDNGDKEPLIHNDGLIKEAPPSFKDNAISTRKNRSFTTRMKPDYAAREASNRDLGLAGEESVLEYEHQKLKNAGLHELAKQVVHTSKIEGDGAGYDIKSYSVEDGSPLYIEVKTTKGAKSSSFYMSENEKVFAETHRESFCLIRVYDFNEESRSGSFYIINGSQVEELTFNPTQYRVSL